MKENSLILKDNDIISIDGKDQIYNIKVLPNSMITINEYNNDGCIINLELDRDCSVNYMSISLKNTKIERNIKLSKGSNLDFNLISLVDTLDNTTIDLNESYSNVSVNNLCISNECGQIMNTKINHNDKFTTSMINNIGVSFNSANILFDTTGFVKNGKNGCDCRQLSKGVIVGDKSKIISKPILLIDEYDVKAYHGATIGKMSDEELFYLMSRGLSKNEAFMLILSGLIDPMVSKIKDESLKGLVEENIKDLLGD